MNYSITTLGKKTIAGFHLVGPWDQTVKQGFEQLMMWVENHQVPAREWVAVYYDNPEEVPAEKLRCATAVAVDEDYVIPANSEGVILIPRETPRVIVITPFFSNALRCVAAALGDRHPSMPVSS